MSFYQANQSVPIIVQSVNIAVRSTLQSYNYNPTLTSFIVTYAMNNATNYITDAINRYGIDSVAQQQSINTIANTIIQDAIAKSSSSQQPMCGNQMIGQQMGLFQQQQQQQQQQPMYGNMMQMPQNPMGMQMRGMHVQQQQSYNPYQIPDTNVNGFGNNAIIYPKNQTPPVQQPVPQTISSKQQPIYQNKTYNVPRRGSSFEPFVYNAVSTLRLTEFEHKTDDKQSSLIGYVTGDITEPCVNVAEAIGIVKTVTKGRLSNKYVFNFTYPQLYTINAVNVKDMELAIQELKTQLDVFEEHDRPASSCLTIVSGILNKYSAGVMLAITNIIVREIKKLTIAGALADANSIAAEAYSLDINHFDELSKLLDPQETNYSTFRANINFNNKLQQITKFVIYDVISNIELCPTTVHNLQPIIKVLGSVEIDNCLVSEYPTIKATALTSTNEEIVAESKETIAKIEEFFSTTLVYMLNNRKAAYTTLAFDEQLSANDDTVSCRISGELIGLTPECDIEYFLLKEVCTDCTPTTIVVSPVPNVTISYYGVYTTNREWLRLHPIKV